MSMKTLETVIIIGLLVGSFLLISDLAEACFTIEVTYEEETKYVDKGGYALYEIEVSLSPGCKSTYWVSFEEGIAPPDWTTEVLDDSGWSIPWGLRLKYSGTVTVIFTLKVTVPGEAPETDPVDITTTILADDDYNQWSEVPVITSTQVNQDGDYAPDPLSLWTNWNTTTSIELEWDHTTESMATFGRYEVHKSNIPNFTPVSGTLYAEFNNPDTVNMTVTGLSPGSTYHFAVRVWDNGVGHLLIGPMFADSNILEAHTPGINYPPHALVLEEPTEVTNRGAHLEWNESYEDDFACYEIHYSHTPGFVPDGENTRLGDPITNISITEIDFVDELDENETTYFIIRVIDAGGLYNDSNEVHCTTEDWDPEASVLYDPFNIAVTYLDLEWSSNCDNDFLRYEVHRSTDEEFTLDESTWVEDITNNQANSTTITALLESTTYYFCIRTFDEAGNYTDSNYVSGTTLDGTPPTVLSTLPIDGAVDCDITDSIVITFSEAMDQGSLNFTCSPDPGGWSANWDSPDVVTLSHSTDFDDQTHYTFTIHNALDLGGNDLTASYSWSFDTKDLTPPEVVANYPDDEAVDVSITTKITITFSEEMNQASVEGAISISPTVSYGTPAWSANKITLDPTSDLDGARKYTVTVGTDAKDLSDNYLASTFSFEFTTVSQDVNHAPQVSVSEPSNDITDESFTIEWTASDPDDDVLTVSLYYDDDKDTENGMTLIQSGVSNTGSFDWDTTELVETNYYVYVKVYDGEFEVGSYSGRLTIDHPEELDTDDDGTPDSVDTDDDNDGISDTQENLDGTDPLDPDTDGDGYDDDEDEFPLDSSRWEVDVGDVEEDDEGDGFPMILLVLIIVIVLILVGIGAWSLSGKKSTAPMSGFVSCPNCGQQIATDPATMPYIKCPYCGTSGMLK